MGADEDHAQTAELHLVAPDGGAIGVDQVQASRRRQRNACEVAVLELVGPDGRPVRALQPQTVEVHDVEDGVPAGVGDEDSDLEPADPTKASVGHRNRVGGGVLDADPRVTRVADAHTSGCHRDADVDGSLDPVAVEVDRDPRCSDDQAVSRAMGQVGLKDDALLDHAAAADRRWRRGGVARHDHDQAEPSQGHRPRDPRSCQHDPTSREGHPGRRYARLSRTGDGSESKCRSRGTPAAAGPRGAVVVRRAAGTTRPRARRFSRAPVRRSATGSRENGCST